jgi:acetyl-CoA carboxylase biotin carboxyl carrier protein
MPEDRAPADRAPARPSAEGAELLALIDRLEALLERSSLTELEVEAGATALVLRTPAALAAEMTHAAPADLPSSAVAAPVAAAEAAASQSRAHAVVAPLTGLYYNSPSPGAQPYVREGGEVQVGQVIGLIEAMKLFNEIKSDVAGRVVRLCVESGALVKAKQPLIEVEPA